MNANPFPSSTTRATKPLELIHTDLHGPFKVRTMSGYRYWITFIDDYTRFRAVIFLKSKNEAFTAFQRYKAYAENHLDAKIQCMRIDKGGEYMSKQFIDFMLNHGITCQYTVQALVMPSAQPGAVGPMGWAVFGRAIAGKSAHGQLSSAFKLGGPDQP